jgi:hypothetical protein
MKKILTALLMFISLNIFAQADITTDVEGLIKAGNSKDLAKYFTDNIDLAIDHSDYDDIASKSQAEQILKKFFDACTVKSFSIKHTGKSQLGIEYRIGELETSCGKHRVTINLKKVGDAFLIHQLRIEDE